MIQAIPYCSREPTGSETRASPSRAAPTTPRLPSIQLPFPIPSPMSWMSSAIHTPDHGLTGAPAGAATSGLAVTGAAGSG